MTRFALLASASTTTLVLLAAPALAEVTAKDVWESWKAQMVIAGQTMTVGSEEQVGNTLVIKDVTISATNEEATGEGKLDEITLEELGDGTVRFIMPDTYPITFVSTGADGTKMSGAVNVSSKGMDMVASGDPGAISYAIKADEVSVSVEKIETEAEEFPLDFALVLKSVDGTYNTTDEGGLAFDLALAAQAMDLTLNASDPANPGDAVSLTGTAQDIVLTESGLFPEGVDTQKAMTEALEKGFKVTLALTTGAANYAMDAQGADSFSGKVSLASTTLDFDMSGPTGFSYLGTGKGLDVIFSSPAMPPVAAKMEEYAFGLTIPMLKSDAAQDMALVTKLVNVTMGEELWGLFDPNKVLSRDPATLIIDVAAKGKMLVDLSDEAAMASATGTPVEMESATINEVRLAAAGTDLSATGDLTFDNSMAAMGGPPMPMGAINVKTLGVNALMDNLVKMGLVPEDQLMGMKMIMGMYAKPGAEPDSLESLIEFKEGGSIFANGTPLQ